MSNRNKLHKKEAEEKHRQEIADLQKDAERLRNKAENYKSQARYYKSQAECYEIELETQKKSIDAYQKTLLQQYRVELERQHLISGDREEQITDDFTKQLKKSQEDIAHKESEIRKFQSHLATKDLKIGQLERRIDAINQAYWGKRSDDADTFTDQFIIRTIEDVFYECEEWSYDLTDKAGHQIAENIKESKLFGSELFGPDITLTEDGVLPDLELAPGDLLQSMLAHFITSRIFADPFFSIDDRYKVSLVDVYNAYETGYNDTRGANIFRSDAVRRMGSAETNASGLANDSIKLFQRVVDLSDDEKERLRGIIFKSAELAHNLRLRKYNIIAVRNYEGNLVSNQNDADVFESKPRSSKNQSTGPAAGKFVIRPGFVKVGDESGENFDRYQALVKAWWVYGYSHPSSESSDNPVTKEDLPSSQDIALSGSDQLEDGHESTRGYEIEHFEAEASPQPMPGEQYEAAITDCSYAPEFIDLPPSPPAGYLQEHDGISEGFSMVDSTR